MQVCPDCRAIALQRLSSGPKDAGADHGVTPWSRALFQDKGLRSRLERNSSDEEGVAVGASVISKTIVYELIGRVKVKGFYTLRC